MVVRVILNPPSPRRFALIGNDDEEYEEVVGLQLPFGLDPVSASCSNNDDDDNNEDFFDVEGLPAAEEMARTRVAKQVLSFSL